MKRVSLEISDFDLEYIYKILLQDFLYSKEVIDRKLYEDDDEKTLLLFCSKHSKFLANKFLSLMKEFN